MSDVNPSNQLSSKPIQELLDLLKKDSPDLSDLAQKALEVFEEKSNPIYNDPVVLFRKELAKIQVGDVASGVTDKPHLLLIGALILYCDANISQRFRQIPN